jgi:inward rectifier potassium channel
MVAGDVRFFLNIDGQDYPLSARVQDTWGYPASEIVFGMRYADAVSQDAARRTTADLTRLSLLEPEDDSA